MAGGAEEGAFWGGRKALCAVQTAATPPTPHPPGAGARALSALRCCRAHEPPYHCSITGCSCRSIATWSPPCWTGHPPTFYHHLNTTCKHIFSTYTYPLYTPSNLFLSSTHPCPRRLLRGFAAAAREELEGITWKLATANDRYKKQVQQCTTRYDTIRHMLQYSQYMQLICAVAVNTFYQHTLQHTFSSHIPINISCQYTLFSHPINALSLLSNTPPPPFSPFQCTVTVTFTGLGWTEK